MFAILRSQILSVLFLVIMLLGNLCMAYASKIEIISVLSVSAFPSPVIKIVKNNLIVATTKKQEIVIISLDDLKKKNILKGGYFPSDMSTHPEGWVAVCLNLGKKIGLFHVDYPNETLLEIDLYKNDEDLLCTGVFIEDSFLNVFPYIWVGDPGRSIYRLDPITESISKKYEGISGPSRLYVTKDFIFTLNDRVVPDSAIPYIFNAYDGKPVVGDPMGNSNHSRLQRGFICNIFVDSKSKSIHYLSRLHKSLYSFNLEHPNMENVSVFRFQSKWPRSIQRYNDCMILLSRGDDKNMWPNFEIIKVSKNKVGETIYKSIHLTGPIKNSMLKGAFSHVVDKVGNIYLSHWQGVSMIKVSYIVNQCQIGN